MKTEELIAKFLEITKYDEDECTLLIMAYGSRIMGCNRDNSDLDILIVTSRNQSYRRAMKIEGIPLDITYISSYDIEVCIHRSLETGSNYYHSLFGNGLVVIDRMNTFETLSNMLDKRVKKKVLLDGRIMDQARYHMGEFLRREKDINYYKALELLRRLHHVKNGCSYIRFTKVYDLYTDKNKAKEQYMLKLPDDNYIKTYLEALDEEEPKKRLEYLLYFYHEFDNVKFEDLDMKLYLLDDDKKRRLYYLYGAINRCIELLKGHHPYAKKIYYIILDDITYLYELFFESSIDITIYETDDPETMERSLKELFDILNKPFAIDCENVILRL